MWLLGTPRRFVAALLYLTTDNMHLLKQLLLFLNILSFHSTIAVEFTLNGFNSRDLLLYGTAILDSHVISLTQNATFSIGRALYHSKIRTRYPNSSALLPFSTSFDFSIAQYKNNLPGHGLVFIIVPSTGIRGTSSAQHLGFLNRTNDGNPTNHVFGIEFDVFKNQEFSDINDNHVGVDVNSLTSLVAYKAGYWFDGNKTDHHNNTHWSFQDLKLNNGANYCVWIDFVNSQLSVTMAPSNMKKPQKPLINVSLDLSEVFLDEMYVGFCAANGQLIENHKILRWSFSNSKLI